MSAPFNFVGEAKTPEEREYLREVIAKTCTIFDESAPDMLADMQGEGIEADCRRAAFDGMINELIDRDVKQFIKAMKIAGITSSQAAQTIGALNMMQGDRS